jgi:hypothetical protein
MSRYFAPAKGWKEPLLNSPPAPTVSYAQLITGFWFSNGDQSQLRVTIRRQLDPSEHAAAMKALTTFLHARQSRIQVVFAKPKDTQDEHSVLINISDLNVSAISDLAVCLTKTLGATGGALDMRLKPVIRPAVYTDAAPAPAPVVPRTPVLLHVLVPG